MTIELLTQKNQCRENRPPELFRLKIPRSLEPKVQWTVLPFSSHPVCQPSPGLLLPRSQVFISFAEAQKMTTGRDQPTAVLLQESLATHWYEMFLSIEWSPMAALGHLAAVPKVTQ